MAARIIDGKKIADEIEKYLKRETERLGRGKATLSLASLQLGKNAASEIYLNAQMSLAKELGIKFYLKTLPASVPQERAEEEIESLNKDRAITGVIVQTPVPKHIDAKRLFEKISPDKDAEGVNPLNIGRIIYDNCIVAPCTASACMRLIDSTGIELRGREVVIVGHSDIVGKPLSLMLLSRMATTTVCHIGTYERNMLKSHVKLAEVLVVSVGKVRLIKGSWIRRGAVVIDVGINRLKGRITGDVEFEEAVKKASYITPVPGGVGPVTVAMLMKNLVALAKENLAP